MYIVIIFVHIISLFSLCQGFVYYINDVESEDYLNNNKLYEKLTKYGAVKCNENYGEYLNLCGECVSGQTEKEEDYGEDSCGVCGGLDTCATECVQSEDQLDEDYIHNCTKLVSLTPNVLDLAQSRRGSIYIVGEGIDARTLTDVDCGLYLDSRTAGDVTSEILSGKIQLTFDVPEEEGSYDLSCNTSVGVEFRESLTVVDSQKLIPMAVDRTTLNTWTEYEVTLTVTGMSSLVDLVCFARHSGQVVYQRWTDAIAGNTLSSSVVCPELLLLHPGEVHIGLAYSQPAISSAKTIKITSVAMPPKPVKTEITSDMTKITVSFDQNLDEDIDTSCHKLFTSRTMTVIGSDSKCNIVANEVGVYIGNEARLKTSQLEFTNQIRTKYSEIFFDGTVLLSVDVSQKEAVVEGASRLCPGRTATVSLRTGSSVGPTVWSLSYAGPPPAGLDLAHVQRLNLGMWRAARSVRPTDNSPLTVNSTSLIPGMRYAVRALTPAGPQLGAVHYLRVARQNETWLQITGPSVARPGLAAVYEASLQSCGSSLLPTSIMWSVEGVNGSLDVSLLRGSRLTVPPGGFQPHSDYTITAKAYLDYDILAQSKLEVRTKGMPPIRSFAEKKLVIGTGQPLLIDGTQIVAQSGQSLKFKWSCQTGYCYFPDKEKKPLEDFETITGAVLNIPPKSMAIGRYILGLELSSVNGGESFSQLEVWVVPGQPPFFSRLQLPPVNPGTDLQIKVTLQEVRHCCQVTWALVPAVGYSYFTLNSSSSSIEGHPTRPSSSLLSLRLARTSLQPGSRIRVKVTADCGPTVKSFLVFDVLVPETFGVDQLQVEPSSGTALDTRHLFKVVGVKRPETFLYKYGYENEGKMYFLYIGHKEEYETFLGEGSYKTVLQICRTEFECLTVHGPQVKIDSSEKLNNIALSEILSGSKDYIMSNCYEEALATIEMFIPTIKVTNVEQFENISAELQKTVFERVQLFNLSLSKSEQRLDESVKFLHFSTSLLSMLAPSDEAMTSILSFRDLIHSSLKEMSGKITETELSSKLPVEPRQRRSTKNSVRRKRGIAEVLSDVHRLETFLKTSALAIRRVNDSETVKNEKLKVIEYVRSYSENLCNDVTNNSVLYAGSEVAALGVTRLTLSKGSKKNFTFPQCGEHCPNATGQMKMTSALYDKFDKHSEGLCLATTFLPDDFLSETSSASSEMDILRWSAVYSIDLLPYDNNVISSIRYNTTERPLVNIKIPIWAGTIPTDRKLQCHVWFDDIGWTSEGCNTTKFREKKTMLECLCRFPGNYSVFGKRIPSGPNERKVSTNSSVVSPPTSSTTLRPSTKLPATTALTLAATMKPTKASEITTAGNVTAATSTTTTANVSLSIVRHQVTSTTSTIVSFHQLTSVPTTILIPITTTQQGEQHTTTETPSLYTMYFASFSINESYSDKVEGKENEFESNVGRQVGEIVSRNLTERSQVEVSRSHGTIKMTLMFQEDRLQELGPALAALADHLKNGTLQITDLNGKLLNIPFQDLKLTQRVAGEGPSAVKVFMCAVFLFLLLLLTAVVAVVYLRTSREQRSLRLTQELADDTPRYLRLHDASSLESFGSSYFTNASHPQNTDLDSGMVLTVQPRRHVYQPVESVSHLSGNI